MKKLKIIFFIPKKKFSASRASAHNIPKLAEKSHQVLIFETQDLSSRKKVLDEIKTFKPDIIHFIWTRKWISFIPQIVKANKDTRIIVDFRSPILLDSWRKGLRREQNFYTLNRKVHGFMTTCLPVLQNNLGVVPENSFEYFVGIPAQNVFDCSQTKGVYSAKSMRLVVVSTLHPKRRLGSLMFYCAIANILSSKKISLDIIGDGENLKQLSFLATSLRVFCRIRMLGYVEPNKINSTIALYDAGVTHLPNKIYKDAPALKTLEYFAASIPVIASKNNYNTRLKEEGFYLSLYNNNVLSFINALRDLSLIELSHLKSNRERVRQYEWQQLFNNIIEPAYFQVLRHKKPVAFGTFNRRWRNKLYRRCREVFRRLLRLFSR